VANCAQGKTAQDYAMAVTVVRIAQAYIVPQNAQANIAVNIVLVILVLKIAVAPDAASVINHIHFRATSINCNGTVNRNIFMAIVYGTALLVTTLNIAIPLWTIPISKKPSITTLLTLLMAL